VARKEYFREIDERTRLRVLVLTERGKVRRFVVQLETFLADTWKPVCRYDTSHGFAHVDILHVSGTADKIRLEVADFNQALDMAFADLLTNWEHYIKSYMEED
jgi:hypothetical protein